MYLQQSVTCEITGVQHQIVQGFQNKNEFMNWADEILTQLNDGIKVFLAVDCEGYSLGVREHSLGFIQIAQCFSSSFLESYNPDSSEKISINLQPGFLIAGPFKGYINTMLTCIFCHENTKLIMFDFTSDIVAMKEAGIRFNMKNIIDCQCVTRCRNYITQKNAPSLAKTCRKAENCVEFEKMKSALADKANMNWSEMHYKYRNENNPFNMMCDERMIKYSASDIALTAIGLIGALKECSYSNLVQNTLSKVDKFNKLQKIHPRAPSIARNHFFTHSKLDEKLENKNMYQIWDVSDVFIHNFEIYQTIGIGVKDSETLEKIRTNSEFRIEITSRKSH